MQTEKGSVSEWAYQTLKRRIMNMQYRPGEVLLIQQLVLDLEVSRTPIKEALIRLCADGFLELYNGKRFRVKTVSLRTVLEVFEVRQALECLSVDALASEIDGEGLREVAHALDEQDAAVASGDTLGVLHWDEQFHLLLLRLHGNRTIEETFLQLNERIQQIRYMTQTGRRITVIGGEHREILAALRAGDGRRASACMGEHLERVRNDMKALLEQKMDALYSNAVLYSNLGV